MRVTLPALIDPHVHFRTPGGEHKEDWHTGARAALGGGVTTVFDMPNTAPSTTTKEFLTQKKLLVEQQLNDARIPLRHFFYLGASSDHIDEIKKCRNDIVGVKMFMGSSTGDLLIDDEKNQRAIFEICAKTDVLLAVHAEDERTLQHSLISDAHIHSKIRPREAAIIAVTKAIRFAKEYRTKTYMLHVSTKEEVMLIREAKANGMPVFAEVTPHHLFLTEENDTTLGNFAKMNPPLRTKADQAALWAGIHDGTIDTIGSDHAPHTIEEKNQPYEKAPSGVPGIETTLPLLLTAYHQGKITIEKIIAITHTNIEQIFRLTPNDDTIEVDLTLRKKVDGQSLETKCGWSPFEDWSLTGWPVSVTLRGKVYPRGR